MVQLEVYTWDDAFNPMSVQPDGSIGGPNWEMCLVDVFVQDPEGLCPECSIPGLVDLGGDIRNSRNGIGVNGVEVLLSGTLDGMSMTNNVGLYSFAGVNNGDYVLTPYKNDDVSVGISTLDAWILQRHLLGQEVITDPYLLIAADVNNSGTITTLDLLIIRNVILGNMTEFPDNTSWRFFDASFSMEDMNVLTTEMPESIVLENLEACTSDLNFVGVKIGDLDGSTIIFENDEGLQESGEGRSETDSYPLHLEDQWLEAGEAYELPIRARNLSNMGGMQFTLELARDLVMVTGVTPGILNDNQLGTTRIAAGRVSASWNQSDEELGSGDQVLFSINLIPNRAVTVAEIMQLVNNPTTTEAYDLTRQTLNMHLQFYTSATSPAGDLASQLPLDMELLQNYPNPFSGNTTIRFYLPQAGEATLTISDLSGRAIQTINGDFPAGYSAVQLNGNGLASGSIFYTLSHSGEEQTRTMVRVRQQTISEVVRNTSFGRIPDSFLYRCLFDYL